MGAMKGLTLNRLMLSRPEVKRKSFNRSNFTSAGDKTATVEVLQGLPVRNSPSGVEVLFTFPDLLLSISGKKTNLIESTKVQTLGAREM